MVVVLCADSCGISLHSALKEAREVLLVDPDEEIDGSGEHAKVVMDPEQLSGFLRAGIDALRNTTDVTVLSIVDSLLTLVRGEPRIAGFVTRLSAPRVVSFRVRWLRPGACR
jgi:hypothetical protein